MSSNRRLASKHSRVFANRQRAKLAMTIGACAIAIAAFFFGISKLTQIRFTTIQSVAVEGADELIAPAVRTAAEKAVEGSYFGLFSKANIILYPRSRVVESVMEVSPRIQAASVKAWDRHTLAVTITEKEPSALICASLPEFDGGALVIDDAECYFADEQAFLFAKAPTFSGAAYKRYYMPSLSTGTSTSLTLIGEQAFSTADFLKVQRFFDGARESGISAEAILVKDDGEYELYAKNRGKDPGEDAGSMVIYFNSVRSFSEQLDNLVSFWSSVPSSYEYVDVRYGSNVFYRIK